MAGSVDSETAVDERLPITSGLASRLDLVTLADATAANTWLIPSTDRSISGVASDAATEYLRRVQKMEPETEDAAREHAEVYRKNLLLSTNPQAESECVPTTFAVGVTVARLSIAIARLELADKVTTAHLESAIRLYDASLEYRSYTAKSPAYWRDCAGDPGYYM